MPFLSESIIIIVMLFFNGIFAAYEIALASISRMRLAVLVNQKRKGAVEAAFMKDRIEASFAVAQVGLTLAGAIAAAVGGAGITESFAPYLEQRYHLSSGLAEGLALTFLIIPFSLAMILFGELIPKTFALHNNVWICLRLSPSMKVLWRVLYPIISVLEGIVKAAIGLATRKGAGKMSRVEDQVRIHELITLTSLARNSRLIGAREEKIVVSAAQLSIRPVREIMLSINDVSMIASTSTLSEALVKAHLDMHTRFPVCSSEEDRNVIEGYINFKDIIAALKLNPSDPSIKGIIRPIKTVIDDAPISHALEKMIQEKLHIALVSSKNSEVIGMITMEDIIEEMLGEIEDEYDRLPTHIHPYSGGWIVGGAVAMGTVAQTAGVGWPADESHIKLADWFAKKNQGGLKGGEIVSAHGLQFMVRKLRRRKLSEAVVTVANRPAVQLKF
jgi:putative hemolysin